MFLRNLQSNSYVNIQLHHFSEVSSKGYGTVPYLCVVDKKAEIHCIFLFAEARLAPLKTVSIPRLEPMAANLAEQVDEFIRAELQTLKYDSVFRFGQILC